MIQRDSSAKIKAFIDLGKDCLVSYTLGKYNSLNHGEQASEAYEIAKAVAKSN